MKAVDGQGVPPLANALFLTFVYIADAQESLTSREVEGLNNLLSDPTWTEDPSMRAGLESLAAHYSSLWKAYDGGSLPRDRKRLAEELARAFRGLDSGASAGLRAALGDFAQRIAKSGTSMLERMKSSRSVHARRAALAELDSLLAQTQADAPLVEDGDDGAPAPRADTHEVKAVLRDLSIWPAAQLDLADANAWKRGRIRVRCARATPETHDVKSFTFVTDPPRAFVYQPGQFVTLDVPMETGTVRRSFTLSSSPSRPHALTITVKRNPAGTVSSWLHQHMSPGAELEITGPHGHFSCFHAPSEKLLFIAAGSGLTPMMSMLRWLSDTASTADVVLINNVRTPEDVIFERELYLISSKLGEQFRFSVVPARVPAGQAWSGPTGHFTEELLRYLAPDFLEREAFVCGPAGYMDMVKGLLQRGGFPGNRFHQESFGGGQSTPPPTPPAAKAAPAKLALTPAPSTPVASESKSAPPTKALAITDTSCEVVFSKSGKSVLCGPDDFILETAEEHGLEFANSCRSGTCGTCRLTKIEGTVLMDGQTALTEQEILDGAVVICIGRAQGRVVLDA